MVCGWDGSGWAGRLDLDPTNVNVWSYTAFNPATVSLSNAWACALSGDGGTMAVGTPSQLILLDTVTGTLQGTIPSPGASNVYTVTYR